MNYKDILNPIDRAVAVASYYHLGQVDKQNQPYIFHVLRVGLKGQTEQEIICGFLHDILEDTLCTFKDLCDWFDFEIADTISLLTHTKDISYNDYVKRISGDKLATQVKRNDIQDNLSRIGTLPREDFERLYDKYSKALGVLR